MKKLMKLLEVEKGAVELKKGTSDSDIKKYTDKGIDVQLVDHSTEKLEEEIPYKVFPDYNVTGIVSGETKTIESHSIKYDKFQDLLKALVTIDKDDNNDNTDVNAIVTTL